MRKRLLLGLIAFATVALPAHTLMAAETAEGPQPSLVGIDLAGLLWVIILFVVLVAVLYKAAWKNVLAGLHAREERIRSAISDADAARAKGEATLKEYSTQLATAEAQVRELLSKATIEAEKIAAGIKMHAQQEAEVIKEKAIKEIESSKAAALTEIYEQTASLATSVAEKILKRNLNADDQRDLVKQSLDELSALHA